MRGSMISTGHGAVELLDPTANGIRPLRLALITFLLSYLKLIIHKTDYNHFQYSYIVNIVKDVHISFIIVCPKLTMDHEQ